MSQKIFFIDAPISQEKRENVGFDCVPMESIVSEGVVTLNPVETGAEIADHFYIKPVVIDIQVIVSNTPMREQSDDIVTVGGFGDSLAETRASAAWLVLRQIQRSGKPFGIQTGFEQVGPVVITRLGAERRAENAEALICDVTLTQIILTSTRTEKLPKEKIAAELATQATPEQHGKAQVDEKKTEEQGSKILGFVQSASMRTLPIPLQVVP